MKAAEVQRIPSYAFYLLFSRFWELSVGVLLCLFCGSGSTCRHVKGPNTHVLDLKPVMKTQSLSYPPHRETWALRPRPPSALSILNFFQPPWETASLVIRRIPSGLGLFGLVGHMRFRV